MLNYPLSYFLVLLDGELVSVSREGLVIIFQALIMITVCLKTKSSERLFCA
jgi:hypothetical protein